MSNPSRFEPDERPAPTVRSLRVLLALCVACGLFVAVAFAVVAAPLEPPAAPVATQTPAMPLVDNRPVPGA